MRIPVSGFLRQPGKHPGQNLHCYETNDIVLGGVQTLIRIQALYGPSPDINTLFRVYTHG